MSLSLSFLVIVFYRTLLLFLFYFCCFNWALVQAQEPLCNSKKNRTSYQASPKCLFSCWPFTHCTILQAQRSKPKFVAQRAPHRPGCSHEAPRGPSRELLPALHPATFPVWFVLTCLPPLTSMQPTATCNRQLQHLNCLELALACPQIKPRAPCPGRIHAFPQSMHDRLVHEVGMALSHAVTSLA